MDINFKILQSKYFNYSKFLILITVIKIFALKNFKINIHQNVSRAFNILHYKRVYICCLSVQFLVNKLAVLNLWKCLLYSEQNQNIWYKPWKMYLLYIEHNRIRWSKFFREKKNIKNDNQLLTLPYAYF